MRIVYLALVGLVLSLISGGLQSVTAQIRIVNHRVQVNILIPQGVAVQVLRVQLDSDRTGIPLQTKNLIRDTKTDFFPLPNGEYALTVSADDGKYLESSTERFSLRGPFGITKQFDIFLRAKFAAKSAEEAPGTIAAPGTSKIDINKANIPKDALKAFEKGLERSEKGKSQEAIKCFQDALKRYPSYLDALNNLAVEYIKLTRYDEAKEQLQQAIKIEPASALAHLNMGIIYNEEKHFTQAAAELNEALKIDFKNPLAHYQLGLAAFQLSDFTAAQLEFETTVNMAAQKIPLSRLYLAEIYKRMSRPNDALNQLETFLSENPADNPYTQVVKEEMEKLKKNTP